MDEPATVKVRATSAGFYGGRRIREDEVFDFTTTRKDDKGKPRLAKWMVLASEPKRKPKLLGGAEAEREKAARAKEERARESN
jgi:hypothetical protein